MALLEVNGLRTGYDGIPVVFGVDLTVEEGEIVALLGSNGAGKTTTLRAISGMVPAFAGEVVFDGRRTTGMRAERITHLGLVHVPEGRGIFPSLGVEETLRLAAAMASVPKAEVPGRLDEAYATFPRLAERRSQTAGTLSGGEQQMLALGRGLIARPRLLMVDEMSQGLAPAIVSELFGNLETFRSRGVSILLVEQFVGQALDLADRAYVLEKGEVVFSGRAGDLARDEEFVRSSYLGTIDLDAADREVDLDAIVVGEQVPVALPPTLLRGVQRRAGEMGITAEELLRKLAEDALAEKTKRGGGARAR